MRKNEMDQIAARLATLKALASPVRLKILDYLKKPTENFPPQVDGDPVADGICADFIRDKLGVNAATASRHLTLLADSGLLIPTRKRGWTFYRRSEEAIAAFVADIAHKL
jgi:DNA-binding transcriptional ArsR family regulator